MEALNNLVLTLQDFMSGKLLVVLLVGTGLWFTIKLRGVQFTQLGKSFKSVFGNIKLNGEKAGKDGMSSFQSLATAIAAQVGTGNLAGAATALVMGGPGAIFWMWISAILGNTKPLMTPEKLPADLFTTPAQLTKANSVNSWQAHSLS